MRDHAILYMYKSDNDLNSVRPIINIIMLTSETKNYIKATIIIQLF